MATNSNDFLATMMLMGGKGDTGFSQIVSIILLASLEYIKRLMDIFVKKVQEYFETKAKMMIDNSEISILRDIHCDKAIVKLKYQKDDKEKDTGSRRDYKYIEAVFYKFSKLRNVSSLYMSRDTFVPGIIKKEFMIEKEIMGIIDELEYDTHNMLSNCTIRIESSCIDSVDLSNCISRWHQEYEIAKEYDLIQNKYIFSIQNINTNIDFSRYNTGNNSAEEMEIKMAPKNIIFSRNIFHSNRRQSNLYGNVVKNVFKRVNFFKDNEEWYKEMGIPYQLGCLFKGKPGTGKSSAIKAIANELDRHVISINFRDIKTTTQFYNLFNNEYIHYTNDVEQESYVRIPLNKRLYVLEEIDTLGDIVLDREFHQGDTKPLVPGKLSLGDILNVFDGNNEYPGRVIVITTNYAEKLDRALLRAGRMDINVEFDCPRLDEIQSYTNFFYKRRTEQLDIQDYNKNETRLSFADITQVLFETDQDETFLLSDKLKIKWEEKKQYQEKMKNSTASTNSGDNDEKKPITEIPGDMSTFIKDCDIDVQNQEPHNTLPNTTQPTGRTVQKPKDKQYLTSQKIKSKDGGFSKMIEQSSDMKGWIDDTVKIEDTINGLQPSNIVELKNGKDFTSDAPPENFRFDKSFSDL